MSTYLVTVEVATSLTGDAGREYARDLIERRGLVVTSVRAVKGKDADWSGYTPKAGQPGSVLGSTRGESLYRHSDGSWSTRPEGRAS